MTTWSRQQIAIMARAVGWGARSDDVAWVAMAESSGNDKVINSIGATGLLQINQPVHVKAHPTWTKSWLQNPMNNLKAGLVLYQAAGSKFDGPWLDSRDKGAGGGWGQHVAGSGSSGATQATDSFGNDPLEDFWNKLLGKPERGPGSEDWENQGLDDLQNPFGSGDLGLGDVATQLGRVAQALAKAGNWLGDSKNWVRIAYVTGGALLALTAVNVIIQPAASRAGRQLAPTVPVRVVTTVRRRRQQAAKKAEAERLAAEREAEKKENSSGQQD